MYLSSQDGDDGHSHPLHVLVFMVAEPLHHQFGSFKPYKEQREQNISTVNTTLTDLIQCYDLSIILFFGFLLCFSLL